MNGEKNSHNLWADVLEYIEIFLYILNQVCIGFVTIYMCWACFSSTFGTMQLHAWLVTIGYSLLMAEGIMCHYNVNPLTLNLKRKSKTTIHWVLLTLGGGCGVAGSLVMLVAEDFKLHTIHSKLGFAAFIMCLVSMLSGLCALFSDSTRKLLKPLLNKTFHNLLGIATFVIALCAQYYGYPYLRRHVDLGFLTLLEVVTLVSLVLTCVGPLKALYQKISSCFQ